VEVYVTLRKAGDAYDNRESDNTGLWQCFVANTHKKGPRLCELLPTAVAHLRTLRSVHETHRDEHRMRAVQAKGCALAEAFIAQRLIASVEEGGMQADLRASHCN
jgi:hypothetical protein